LKATHRTERALVTSQSVAKYFVAITFLLRLGEEASIVTNSGVKLKE